MSIEPLDNYNVGESIIFELTLKDENENIINLSELLTIAITICNAISGVVLKSGTYAAGDITYDDAASGVIQFRIESSLTTIAAEYKYILTTTVTDTDFVGDVNTSKANGPAFNIDDNGCSN